MSDTLITPEVRALIGQESPPERNRFAISQEMAYDLADATEDPNPLYVDPEYAERSRFGGILCPPLATWKDITPPIGFFGAGQESHFQVPLPFNSYGLNGGSDWQFLRPAYAGEWITRRFRILDIYEKQGRAGPLVFVVRQEFQTNQHGQVINTARRVSIHRALPKEEEAASDLGTVGEELKAVPVSPPGPDVVVPKPEAKEETQRYFEEVSAGLELPPVVKGPLTTTHLVRWAAANGNYARIHWDLPFAQLRQGMANVVVNGSLKNQYLGQLMIGFAGEQGWFKRLYVEHRGMDYPGDVLTAFGVVTGKREAPADPSSGGGRQEGFGYVDCRMGLRNSRGEQTASGWATVILPKRGQSLPLAWEAED